MFPRVTHPSATKCKSKPLHSVRLACVKRAASVRSEPGSNSQVKPFVPKRPPASYLSDASQIYMRLPKLRRLYILSFLFFTSFNDRVSIYILSPLPRQPIFLLFFNFSSLYPYLFNKTPLRALFDKEILIHVTYLILFSRKDNVSFDILHLLPILSKSRSSGLK